MDLENETVSVAVGEKWGNVFYKVSALGFGVVGQRHFGGGIGGDTVQGESTTDIDCHALIFLVVLSYLSYAHGFVGDNVTNYEVALASGEIVKAKSSTNKDLWSALKGGGNSFGIVTRYDLAIFPQGDMWCGKVFYF